MTMPRDVKLRHISDTNAEDIVRYLTGTVRLGITVRNGSGVNLGSASRDRQLNALLEQIRKGKTVYLLDWEGSKVPRGVVIEGREIAWTQNGIVSAANGSHIGTYERTVEWGGDSREHHQMLIYA